MVLSGIILGVVSNAVYDLSKAGVVAFFSGTVADRAIRATANDHREIGVVADALRRWCKSDDFIEKLESIRAGQTEGADEALVDSFVRVGLFHDGLLHTHESARRVLETFAQHLRRELYKSEDGLLIESARADLRQQETNEGLAAIREEVRAGFEQGSRTEVDNLKRPTIITLQSISEACAKVTLGVSREIIGGQKLIVRRKFRREVDRFIGSSTLYGFVTGPSGVGKSAAFAIEAQRLLADGWLVLLLPMLPGTLFSFENAAGMIGQHLHDGSIRLQWHQVVQTLSDGEEPSPPKFTVFIDAIDEADPDHISGQLSLLHQSVVDIPPDRLKILMSCRDQQWERFMRNNLLPLYVKSGDPGARVTRRAYELFEVGDFTTDELDAVLEAIGDDTLLILTHDGMHADSHVLTLRDLIKHPATFQHYADLRVRGDVTGNESVTWSSLIESRLQISLRDAERHCQRPADELREDLIELAGIGWAQSARDYSVEVESVKERLPGLLIRRGEMATPYEALLSSGILLESAGPGGTLVAKFRIADAGSYLLSYMLERRATVTDDAFREMVAGWLSEAWNYSPLLDALLAWVNRLSDRPRAPRLLLLLGAIFNSHRGETLFSLMHPAVLGSLFEMLKRGDEDEIWRIREAAAEVRASPVIWPVISRHLNDLKPEVRRLAVQLASQHRREEFIPHLVELLGDEDEDVRHEVFVGFSLLGRAAIPVLLDALTDQTKLAELRVRYLSALRNIGYRDDKISESISQCIIEGEDDGLLQSTLLLAAHLRDRQQTQHAIAALAHENRRVVQAAAKLLTEAPAPEAFDALMGVLRPKKNDDDKALVNRNLLPRQLMAALIKVNPSGGEDVVIDMIREGLEGAGELSAVEAVRATERFGIAVAYALVLERTVADLEGQSDKNILFWSSEMLGSAWKWNELESLSAAARKLLTQGVDLARLFVDAIVPNMPEHDEYPMGDRLNRAKDLHACIKAKAENFITETCRLLPIAPELSAAELCTFLWVAADTRAEDALLERLGRPTDEVGRAWYARNTVARALGTCGTSRGGQAVLSLLRSDKEISYYFHQEALHPLLQRGVIQADELVRIVEDVNASAGGRTASILAVAELGAETYKDVFLKRIGDDENELVQLYAVRLLGFTKDKSVTPVLRDRLRNSSRPAVKSQAAEALGRLDAREAVPEIEDALEDAEPTKETELSGFLSALARFGERSSLELILQKLEGNQRVTRRQYLEALGAFSRDPRGEGVIRERFEEFASGQLDIFDEQGSLLGGVAQHAPNLVLENASTQYDRGRLTSGGRQEIARSIVRFFRDDSTDKSLLIETAQRLVCDTELAVRERAMHALRFTSPAFCQQLYDELWSDPHADEWKRACAVQTLGYWDADLSIIESARFGQELLVRRAADEAIEYRARRQELQKHLEQFSGADGLGRLSSYLCLKKHGDLSTVWTLNETVPRNTLTHTFVRHLAQDIRDRLRNDYRKRQEEQEKFLKSRGTIYFD